MKRNAFAHLLWIVAGAALGFSSAFVFGDVLALPRRWFLVPHVALTLAFLFAYQRWSGTELGKLFGRRWIPGLVAAAAIAVFLINNVLGQPASPRPRGVSLWLDLVWLGVVYGAVDALLLSVLPIVATWHAGELLGWTKRWPGRVGVAVMAIVASAFITAVYHLGYAEFRGPSVRKAVTGNVVMSAGQLISMNPIAATGSHVAMHVAAVLHGPESTVQLPPHRAPGVAPLP